MVPQIFEKNTKHRGTRGEYNKWCTTKERKATVWLQAAVWKIRGAVER
jgi:hypothetical protein